MATAAEVARQARERYRAAYEMREGGASWSQVARALGWNSGKRQACEQVSKYIERHGPPPWPDIPDPEPKPEPPPRPPKPRAAPRPRTQPRPKPKAPTKPKPEPAPRVRPGAGDVVTIEFKGGPVAGEVIRAEGERLFVRFSSRAGLVGVPRERVVAFREAR